MKALLLLFISFLAMSYPTHGQAHNAGEAKMENDYIRVQRSEDLNEVILSFYIQKEPVFSIGEKMHDINEAAYMNGYNWEAFLTYYLDNKHPDILKGMETDSEAGLYTAFYKLNSRNITKAEKLAGIIVSLIEDPNSLYAFLREEGEQIKWE